MARKLLCMVALISLVLLVQASGSLATTYNFTDPEILEMTHIAHGGKILLTMETHP